MYVRSGLVMQTLTACGASAMFYCQMRGRESVLQKLVMKRSGIGLTGFSPILPDRQLFMGFKTNLNSQDQ